jgi:hypothetical protein
MMTLMPIEQTRKVTIELPEPIYRLLAQLADATQQPLEMLAAQSVTGNLPPSIQGTPEGLKDELLAMQTLSIDELLEIVDQQVEVDRQARHLTLLEKNSAGTLNVEEREELSALRDEADQLMLRRAYAWALLRWRGRRIPSLGELPLP